MVIFVVSKELIMTWENVNGRNELVEVIKSFRKLSDAIAFLNEYDYYSDENVKENGLSMTEDLINDSFWVNADEKSVVLCSEAKFKNDRMQVNYNLYIEEIELV